MARLLTLHTLILLVASSATAEVVIELLDDPLRAQDRAVRDEPLQRSEKSPTLASMSSRGNVPYPFDWYIPRFEVDTTSHGASTLWAVRNESGFNVDLVVTYRDIFYAHQRQDVFQLVPREVKTVNVRDVAGLAVDPDGFARGLVQFVSNFPAVSVDVLQVDVVNNFAQGDVAWTLDDFCTDWMGRFISFAPGQGSVFSFFINGPRGVALSDDPTILGDVYDESGTFINSFTIRTDQWSVSVPIHDAVLGDVPFGSVELSINAVTAPGGTLSVAHSAHGRYSAGLSGICRD